MKLQLLGTAAGEGMPALFCGCETCRRVRESGGKSLRSRSSLQIDDVFKIDVPPDTYHHNVRFGIDLSKLKYIFMTHSHQDHFLAKQFKFTKAPYAYDMEHIIQVYGNDKVIDSLSGYLDENNSMRLNPARPFEPIQADYLKFIPIPGNHAPEEEALNYIIQSDTGSVLYGCDGGFYSDETYEFLKGFKFDLVIRECTHGHRESAFGYHMTWLNVVAERDKFAQMGVIDGSTKVLVTHFSHNCKMLHEEFEALAEPEGIGVCYDGIVFEV